MNWGLLLLVLCLALAGFALYRTTEVQRDLRRVEERMAHAITAEDLDETVLPLFDEVQHGQATLQRSFTALSAQLARVSGSCPAGVKASPEEEQEDPDAYEHDDASGEEDGEDDEDERGDAPNLQHLLSSMAHVIGSLQAPAQPQATTRLLVAVRAPERAAVGGSLPVLIEDVDEADETPNGE